MGWIVLYKCRSAVGKFGVGSAGCDVSLDGFELSADWFGQICGRFKRRGEECGSGLFVCLLLWTCLGQSL